MVDIDQTIKDLQARIAEYEIEGALRESSILGRSTPITATLERGGRRQSDSGFNTVPGRGPMQSGYRNKSNYGKDEHDSDDETVSFPKISAAGGLRQEFVKSETMHGQGSVKSTERKHESPDYDLGKYLTGRDTRERPVEMVHSKHEQTPLTRAQGLRDGHEEEFEPGITYRRRPTQRADRYPRRDRLRFDEDEHTERVNKPHIKPATYDGTSSWLDYRAHFEACAALCKWTEAEKGLYLAVSLRGQAQGVLGNLPGGGIKQYADLIKVLNERFSPPNQTELYRSQLRERRQRASETLPELGQSIRRLTTQAYPSAPMDLIETLAKEQFIDALVDSDMRLRIKQARPTSLNDAIRHAVELEAFSKAEQKLRESHGFLRPVSESDTEKQHEQQELNSITRTLSELQEAMVGLQREMKNIKLGYSKGAKDKGFAQNQSRANWKKNATCHNCGKKGHLMRECQEKKRNPTPASAKTNNLQDSEKQTDSSKAEETESVNNKQGGHGVHRQVGDVGIFVEAFVGQVPVKFLVDTGATVTLISKTVFDLIQRTMQTDIKVTELERDILTANEAPMEVYGRAELCIKIGKERYWKTVIVAKMSNDGMLGLDFMKENNTVVDLVKQNMKLGTQTVPLLSEGRIGCYHVAVAEAVNIPPRTEIVTFGKVCLPPNTFIPEGISLVEQDEIFAQGDRALIAKTLVNNKKEVPLRIMNLSSEVRTLHPDTVVGTMSPVDEVVTKVRLENAQKDKHLPAHLQDLWKRSIEGLTSKQAKQVKDLLLKHSQLFAENDQDLGRTEIVKHRINTGNHVPIKQPLRRTPVHLDSEVDKHLGDMLERGVVEPSKSPWASGIVLVKKKDGSNRFCVDYRRLNAATIKDAYPLPKIDECLDQLTGACWFSTVDLCSGYWQVGVEPDDRPKTAFVTKKGLFQFTVMPFGLCNAPATFQRLMETVLNGLQWDICLIYLDDVIIFGKTFEDMVANIEIVFGRMESAGLKLKAKKCHLFAREVEFLGHIITENGVSTDPGKTAVIKAWQEPANVTEMRSFLGLCSYYRRFIHDFASIAKPLHKLTEKGRKFVWTNQCQEAFDTLKGKLTESPILAFPDFNTEFILDCDASDLAIGAVLSQVQGDQERPIAYASRTLTKSEKNYCVTRKELLAVVYFVKYFRHYLLGKPFVVRTDHSSLRWLLNFKNPEGQVARWIEVLSMYNFRIEHRSGTKHKNADALSRRPCSKCKFHSDRGPETLNIVGIEKEQTKEESKLEGQNLAGNKPDSLRSLQKQDKDIAKVKAWIEGKTQPQPNDIRSGGMMIKSLWSQRQILVIRDDVLFRIWEDYKGKIFQAIVPMSERKNVLRFSHDLRTSGHLGVRKTLSRVRQSFYWPGLQRDVRQYIAGCEICTKRKSPTQKKVAPMQIVRSGMPMERIATDILGELPMTDRGNRYILVVSDYFTKWTEAFPMPNMEARTVAELVVNEVIARFGVPSIIHSDQGKQFEGKVFQEMCELLHIKKTRTAPYNPQSDGMVERFNKTLVTMLSSYVNDHHSDWDNHIPHVMMAYRSVEHETTGCSPNYLMLGREVCTPLEVMYEMPHCVKSIPENKWAWELKERLETGHTHVRQHLQGAMLRQKSLHDRKLNWQLFDPGDEVYVYFPRHLPGQSPKLVSFWRGPFKVLAKYTDVTYEVACGRKGKPQVIHVDRMRPKKDQRLTHEPLQAKGEAPDVIDHNDGLPESLACKDMKEPVKELCVEDMAEKDTESLAPGSRRTRRPPKWLSDYDVE